MEVSKIIENEQSDVNSKINDFMNIKKKKGIDLDGDSKEEKKETTPKIDTEMPSKTIDTSSYDSEPSFGLGRQRVLEREFERSRRSCGGGGGCGR